jgi:bifunctional non-homologous end joining protein LigD
VPGRGRTSGSGGDPLATYRAKRAPARTAEPVPPAGRPLPEGAGDTFVVQEHRTPRGRTGERVHWDLRLERDGVLRSWAVPKGPPLVPGENRLAVPTEDHPLEYATFAGEIAAGEYGAGHVSIWDAGRYETEKWDDRHVLVRFDGSRLSGRYVLFPLEDGAWNLARLDPADSPLPARLSPSRFTPMLATPADLPDDDSAWGYEFKWDGVRALAYVQGGTLAIRSRKAVDLTERYPELRPLPDVLSAHDVVVDGEIVALDAQGRPDFGALQHRMHRTGGAEVGRMAAAAPVTYLVFDLLFLDGEDLLDLPYAQRRERLDGLHLTGGRWAETPWFRGGGAQVRAASLENGLEGVVAKRLDSPYRPGVRGPEWRKVKNIRSQAVVVGGWRPGQGRRAGGVGSLLVGVPDDDGRLVYVGHVGTGFTQQDLRDLEGMMTPRRTSPFDGSLPREVTRDAHWVEPALVGEVGYAVWTADGRLRHPAWRGLRDDLDVEDVVLEW